VLVTPAGARRQLGPLAWTVLEALLLDVNDDADGVPIVHTSLRSLAGELGLDKDTVGRALARLGQAGVVRQRGAPAPAAHTTMWRPLLVRIMI
jgi:DNA-binding MarR family transcriptional regulator